MIERGATVERTSATTAARSMNWRQSASERGIDVGDDARPRTGRAVFGVRKPSLAPESSHRRSLRLASRLWFCLRRQPATNPSRPVAGPHGHMLGSAPPVQPDRIPSRIPGSGERAESVGESYRNPSKYKTLENRSLSTLDPPDVRIGFGGPYTTVHPKTELRCLVTTAICIARISQATCYRRVATWRWNHGCRVAWLLPLKHERVDERTTPS